MQKELVNMNFSEREAAHIVKFIGGHLGHVQDFLQTMKIANGKLLVRGNVFTVPPPATLLTPLLQRVLNKLSLNLMTNCCKYCWVTIVAK
jgi:hypothetical protein